MDIALLLNMVQMTVRLVINRKVGTSWRSLTDTVNTSLPVTQ